MGRETREFDAPEVLDGTIVLQLGYDGTGYSGFAEQPGQTTVAGEIRRAVETFLRRPIELTCAGRTDAGVHAISQYVSFPATAAELEITRSRWMRALVALLPRDIAVREVWHAAPGFSYDGPMRPQGVRMPRSIAGGEYARGKTRCCFAG